jgi:hypothetical protein
VASAREAIEISKNTNELVFDDYIKDIMSAMGLSPGGLSKMWQVQSESMKRATGPSRYPNSRGKSLVKVTQDALRAQLHLGSQSIALYEAVLTGIHESLLWNNLRPRIMLGMEPSSTAFLEISLAEWCQPTLLEAVINSVFGPSLLVHYPGLLESFSQFDENSWHLTYRIPKPWSNKMETAKKACIDALRSYLLLPVEKRTGVFWVIKVMVSEMRASEMHESDMAASLLLAFWA